MVLIGVSTCLWSLGRATMVSCPPGKVSDVLHSSLISTPPTISIISSGRHLLPRLTAWVGLQVHTAVWLRARVGSIQLSGTSRVPVMHRTLKGDYRKSWRTHNLNVHDLHGGKAMQERDDIQIRYLIDRLGHLGST